MDLRSALPGVGLGPLRMNSAALTSRPRIYGNYDRPTSARR